MASHSQKPNRCLQENFFYEYYYIFAVCAQTSKNLYGHLSYSYVRDTSG